MNKNEFIGLPEQTRRNIFIETATRKALPAVAIEKDWWVTSVLHALFSLSYTGYLSFKGGTSLSKCYNLIERFSEDVDIAINREKFGFTGTLTKTQISDKLRRDTCKFVRDEFQFDVKKELESNNIDSNLFSVNVNITSVTTTDPETVEIIYQTLFDDSDYLIPVVKIEVSGRSMNEPLQIVKLQSFVDEVFVNKPFVNDSFDVNAVVPHRTFIEKICLLHEEFAKQKNDMRSERMSRHLYDLERIMNTDIVEEALNNKNLYNSVVKHRRNFIRLKGFDYDTLAPKTINIVPPDHIIGLWKNDYETMQRTMIYGESLPFDKLIEKIKKLNERINQLEIILD